MLSNPNGKWVKTPNINGIQFEYHRTDQCSYSINETIEEYYSERVSQGLDYAIIMGSKVVNPISWFESVAMLYNLLLEETQTKYNINISEYTLFSKDTPFISVMFLVYFDTIEEAQQKIKEFSLKYKNRLNGIFRWSYFYESDDIKPHVVTTIQGLGSMEYRDYVVFKENFKEFLKPIEYDKNKPFIRNDLKYKISNLFNKIKDILR